jgi:hypothetical protein
MLATDLLNNSQCRSGDVAQNCYCIRIDTDYCCYGLGDIVQSVQCTEAISDLLCFHIWTLIISDESTRALWKIPAETHGSEAFEKHYVKCPLILPAKYLCHTSQGSLTCHKILRHGADSFTSSPKEVILRIFSPLKIHCPLSGLNPQTTS